MSFPKYPEYKDSGVEWLGEVPAHWSITPLKFSASCNDTVLPESTDDDYEIEYVEISDVNEVSGITGSASYKFSDAPSRARRMLQDGDVLISTVRTYLRAIAPVVNPPENLIASTGFAVVRPRKGILDGAFLGYLLRAEWWISEVIARSVGVSYPAINASDLIGLNIPVPALQEQTQIARFLDHETARIDALIEEQQRLIELLKEKRQAVISHAVTKGLDPTVPMKDSGVEWLGEVPAHWQVGALKHFLSPVPGAIKTGPFGSHLKSEDMKEGPYKVFNQRNVIDADFSAGDNFISEEKFAELRGFTAFPGDVLVTTRGTIGRAAILPDNAEVGILHPCLLRVQVEKSKIASSYFCRLVQESHLLKTQLALMSNSTTIEVVYSETMANLFIPVPPMAEQGQIAAFLDDVIRKFDALANDANESVRLLQERRSALISAAVTGKIDVRNWQPPAGQYPAGDTQNRTEPEVA